MRKQIGAILAITLTASGYAYQQGKPPEKQKALPPLSAEEKEMLKHRELLDNLELLQNFEQIQLLDFLSAKKPEKGKDKAAAKAAAKNGGKPL